MDGVIELGSAHYPALLYAIDDPPKKLFFKGIWDSRLFDHCLAVVGSRKMTRYGKQITETLISEIASFGITIVSGFMYGIDACAHQAAVTSGGRTIAVMPCGIDRIHPEYQENLYRNILEHNGLIISEYEDNYPPMLWTYPRRNRIVAGLSQATMVVEAGPKSGSLITARLAKKYQRNVFVVAGQINSTLFKGVKQLLKEGARIVTESDDVLRFYGIQKQDFLKKTVGDDRDCSINQETAGIESLLVKELLCESLEIDVLARKLNVSSAEIGSKLSLMELQGIVAQAAGKYYVN